MLKLSKKLKRKLKKRLLTGLSSITVVLMLLAGSKMADFSAPFGKLMSADDLSRIAGETSKIAENENSGIAVVSETATTFALSSANRLQNTDTITYIYDAEDLAAFRDAVNAGNNYSGKTVYLMDDIDLSTVCSSSLGSWVPIGTSTVFEGTFDGNYYTISNLYYNGSSYQNVGLFAVNSANSIIRNVLFKNVNIYNSYNVVLNDVFTGTLIGTNQGKVMNCGVINRKPYCQKNNC